MGSVATPRFVKEHNEYIGKGMCPGERCYQVTATTASCPDFTRWQWASLTERAWWKPLFEERRTPFVDLERWSVSDGLRKARISFVPIETWQTWPGGRTTTNLCSCRWRRAHERVVCVVGSPDRPMRSGWSICKPDRYAKSCHGREGKIGDLLGFPACCVSTLTPHGAAASR